MRHIALHVASLVSAAAAASVAAEVPSTPSRVKVMASGEVETPPDIATIDFSVRGEGRSSDAAAAALVVRKDAIEAGVEQFADTRIEMKTDRLSIDEARGKDCGEDDYDSSSRLNTGPCAIIGYIATISVRIRAAPIDRAGTLVSLIGRLGGSDVRLSGFALRDDRDAQRRALAAAVANGRDQAEAIAAASDAKLGHLVNVEDSRTSRDEGAGDIVVTGMKRQSALPPPIAIAISPRPIVTSATLVLTYEIAGR